MTRESVEIYTLLGKMANRFVIDNEMVPNDVDGTPINEAFFGLMKYLKKIGKVNEYIVNNETVCETPDMTAGCIFISWICSDNTLNHAYFNWYI